MTESKKKGLSDAVATIINGLIGGVFGIIIALIGVGFLPFSNSDVDVQSIPAPQGSGTWTDQNDVTHRYWVYKGFPEWEKAEEFCETLGGHLVTITSPEEQTHVYEKYIKKNIPDTTCVWIGIQRNNGLWNQWVNGEEFQYANWSEAAPPEPYNEKFHGSINNYAYMGVGADSAVPQGQWVLVVNDEEKQYNAEGWLICEWDYD